MKSKALRKPQKKLSRKDTIKFIDEETLRLKSNVTAENVIPTLRKLTEVRKKAKAIEYREGIVETYLASAVINGNVYGTDEAVTKNFTAALKLAEKFLYRKGIAYAKMGIARAYCITYGKDNTESMYAVSEVLSLARQENDQYLEWHALKQLSAIYGSLGEISRGYALFEEALVIAEKRGVAIDIILTIIDADSMLPISSLYEKHLQRAVELAGTAGVNSYLKSITFLNYAHVLLQLERYDEGDAYVERAWELLPTLAPVREGTMRGSIGSIYLERGRKDDAHQEFRRALEVGMSPAMAVYVNAEMGRMHAKSDPQKALQYFEEGLRFTNQYRELEHASLLHGYLADFYSSIGELEKASQQYALYKTLTEESKKRENKQRAEYAETILRFDQSQKHEKQLTEEVEVKSAALASKAMALAEQTELMANFRDDLRAILRKVEVNDPAITEIRKKLRELPEAVNWKEFDAQFQSVHPQFAKVLGERFPHLTKMESKLCVLFRLSLSSRDVSKLLSLSIRTVELHRHHIRKKLGLDPKEDIAKYLSKF